MDYADKLTPKPVVHFCAAAPVHIPAAVDNPALRKQWAEAIPNVAQLWAAGLEEKGVPGNAVLKGFIDKLKAAGADVPRDWSAE